MIGPTDFNPERIQLEDDIVRRRRRTRTSATASRRRRGCTRLQLRQLRAAADAAPHPRRRRARSARSPGPQTADELAIATFNVENLSRSTRRRSSPARRSDRRQPACAGHRRSRGDPGQRREADARLDGHRRDAHVQQLIAAIQAAGGPTYQFRQIDPVDDQDGGAAGRQHPRRLPLPHRPRPRVRRPARAAPSTAERRDAQQQGAAPLQPGPHRPGERWRGTRAASRSRASSRSGARRSS